MNKVLDGNLFRLVGGVELHEAQDALYVVDAQRAAFVSQASRAFISLLVVRSLFTTPR